MSACSPLSSDCYPFILQAVALTRVLALDPTKSADPAKLRDFQDQIRAGIPAYVLHPAVTCACIRRIAGRTYLTPSTLITRTDIDNKGSLYNAVTPLDFFRALVNDRVDKGEPLTETEVRDYLSDFKSDVSASAVECWCTAVNGVFAPVIHQWCVENELRFLPVTPYSMQNVTGKDKHNPLDKPHTQSCESHWSA